MIGSLFHEKWKLTEQKIYIHSISFSGSCIDCGSGQGSRVYQRLFMDINYYSSVSFWLCSDVRTGVAHVIVQMVVVQNCILMGYFFIIEYTKWLFDETKKI